MRKDSGKDTKNKAGEKQYGKNRCAELDAKKENSRRQFQKIGNCPSGNIERPWREEFVGFGSHL